MAPFNTNPTVQDYLFAWGTETTDLDHVIVQATVGHTGDFSGRKPITDDPWPFTVENCAYAAYAQGFWDRDGMLLFCSGCGLDCT